MLNFLKIQKQDHSTVLNLEWPKTNETDHEDRMEIRLTETEIAEIETFSKKILQRFASEIMAEQVHSDSFRNRPKVTETTSGLAAEVKDPNQMELPLTSITTTATQVAEKKPKRGRKAKVSVESAVTDLEDAINMPISAIDITVKPELPPIEVSFIATVESVPATIDDLRTAVQEFISKNGKTEVAAQTAKLKALFATYGGSDVSTFPKNKIAECITKIQSL